jgi:hypothetical protein
MAATPPGCVGQCPPASCAPEQPTDNTQHCSLHRILNPWCDQPLCYSLTVLTSSDDVPKAFLVMIPGERIGDAIRIRMLHAVSVYRPSAIGDDTLAGTPSLTPAWPPIRMYSPRSRGQHLVYGRVPGHCLLLCSQRPSPQSSSHGCQQVD